MSNLCISRGYDGLITAAMTDMKGENPGVIGNLDGDFAVTFGTTSSGYGSELFIVGTSGSNADVKDASQNMSWWGSGYSVSVLDQDNESNFQWNVSGGSLDYSNTSRAAQLEVTQNASDNIFTFGWGDATVVDSGSYNIFEFGSGAVEYASTAASVGAMVFGGTGLASYYINGNYGIFTQGTGASTYQINSDASEYDSGTYGKYNFISSNAPSDITDNGFNSYIVQNDSSSTLTANGVYSIARVSDNNQVTLGAEGIMSLVFAGGKTTATDSDGLTYDLGQNLWQNGWSNYGTNLNNGYLTEFASGHSQHLTGYYLNAGYGESIGLFGALSLGDNYAIANEKYLFGGKNLVTSTSDIDWICNQDDESSTEIEWIYD